MTHEALNKLSSIERLAVQEVLIGVFKENVDDLRETMKDLTDSLDALSTAINGRLDMVERRQNNMKSFVAGVAFTFSAIGSAVVVFMDWVFKFTSSHHGGG